MRLSRRSLFRRSLLLAALALPACDPAIELVRVSPIVPEELQVGPRQYTVDDVYAGTVDPEVYLTELSSHSLSVHKAKSDGILMDILYNPSDEDLRTILTTYFEERTRGADVESLVRDGIDTYNVVLDFKLLASGAVPTVLGMFGMRQPTYVVLPEEFFNEDIIKSDSDVQSAIGHELRHNADWYNGILLGDFHLTFNTMSRHTIDLEFFNSLFELRAHYGDLRDAFRQATETGESPISNELMTNYGANYVINWNNVKDTPDTALERTLSERQLKEFSGIVVREDPDSPNIHTIHFDLFDKQLSYSVTFHGRE